jgi:hypothetical protein
MTFSSAVISVLERPRHAAPGDLVLLLADDRLAVEPDRSARRPVHAGHRVEAGGLAGAVRADQTEDLAPAQREADVVEGDHTAEPQRDMVNVKKDIRIAYGTGFVIGHRATGRRRLVDGPRVLPVELLRSLDVGFAHAVSPLRSEPA